jgi:hypothetical protein
MVIARILKRSGIYFGKSKMKIRNGFVSNSSSSCFVCNPIGGTNDYNKDYKNYTVEEATEILRKMLDFYNDIFDRDLKFDKAFGEIKIAEEEDIKFLKDWDDSWTRDRVEGKLLICSACDNTIPYELFDFISTKFHAWREHLG